ncbi:peptidylprolyl isomerase [Qipengyuania zhejiangensis]|uniref:peptidylprolyl isomerase n=1 Tax=Qipengyuania zhejiangensis TaxID=3077782 RepID=UPI002D788A33|nr:peptidylprolyl isomerase [Qipengyuania sp. Z2]
MTLLARALALAALISSPLAAQDAAAPEPHKDRVLLETTAGSITVAVETERAPVTAANFLRYVDEGRFDGIVFYRAMRLEWGEQPNGLIQAGTQYDARRTLDPIAHEPTSETGVVHERGTLSMARYAPGTATGDFSILLQAQPSMDAEPLSDDPERRAGFAAFGKVVGGMDVVEAIHAMPTDPDKGEGWMKGQMLAAPVTITTARRLADD